MSAEPRAPLGTIAQLAASVLRHYKPETAPPGFTIDTLLKQFLSQMGTRHKENDADEFEWRVLFVAGMWFQDLFNYDFRRTEMCIIPYATQMGEISFCAYNTGIGWRNIIEKMHMTATLTKWYEEHGRHEIFAGNKPVPLSSIEHTLKLNAEAVAAGAQTDLDVLGIAKNARDEKIAARKKKDLSPEEQAKHAEMEKLYRQHVLKEAPGSPVIQIQGLKKAPKSDAVTH